MDNMSYWYYDTMNWAFARNDDTGEVFLVTKQGLKKPSKPMNIDPMWGGLTKEQALELAV